jgi:hypothetical protein
LYRNPFGELLPAERAELAVVDVRPWGEWLREGAGLGQSRSRQRIVQLVGPCGHGKTTFLLSLCRYLSHHLESEPGYVYVPPESPYPGIPSATPLVVDEADRLPSRQRRQMLNATGLLAIATHRDIASFFPQNRFEIRTFHVANRGNPVRLAAMLNRRVRASAVGNGPIPRISVLQASRLIARFGDDIRAIEEFLYDAFQQLKVNANGQMRFDDRIDRPS